MVLKSLFALTGSEIAAELGLSKPYQGRQIYSWLCRGVTSFDRMTDIPLALRERLSMSGISVCSSTVLDKQIDSDGACKLALSLYDRNIVECVLLTDREGNLTACLSSQVGCAMGCAFCRTGTLRLTRNLEAFEIVEQFIHLQATASALGVISHVVFMGMGEPLANLGNVLKSIEFLHDPKGIGLSHRRITVSTCGLVPGIERLGKAGVPVRLAVSLVAATDKKRSALMPVNRTFGLAGLRRSLENFPGSRRLTFEYCMIPDQNMSQQDAVSLAGFCKGLEVIVNLIPYNPCEELPFSAPSRSQIRTFTGYLDSLEVPYTIRVSRGRGIKGACGQLAAKFQNSSET